MADNKDNPFEVLKSKLIELVREREELWNQRSERYRVKHTLKNKIWGRIGQQLGVDGAVAKALWKNLRDQFGREIKKMKPKSGTGLEDDDSDDDMPTSGWVYFPLLRFLCDTMAPRKMSSNLGVLEDMIIVNEPDGVDDIIETVYDDNEHDDGRAQHEAGEIRPESSEVRRSSDEVRRSSHEVRRASGEVRRPPDEHDQDDEPLANRSVGKRGRSASAQIVELEKKKLHFFEQKLTQERDRDAKEDDVDLLFLKSLLPEMKKTQNPLALRLEILTTIKDHLYINRAQ